jgi:hypothetical protein
MESTLFNRCSFQDFVKVSVDVVHNLEPGIRKSPLALWSEHILDMIISCWWDKNIGIAILIGDVRRKGKYTPIVKDVLNFPHGELRSIIIKIQHNCTSDRRAYGKLEDPPIKHEYCIVFKKVADDYQSIKPISNDQLEIEEAIRSSQSAGR